MRTGSRSAEAGPTEGSARPAALPGRVDPARESPPRPRRPAACRARAAAASRAGPGTRAYFVPQPTAGHDRPRCRAAAAPGGAAPRTHQAAAGAGHGPRPAGAARAPVAL